MPSPQALPFVTAVDLAPMLVIMGLLLGLAWRVVRHLRRRAGIAIPDLPDLPDLANLPGRYRRGD